MRAALAVTATVLITTLGAWRSLPHEHPRCYADVRPPTPQAWFNFSLDNVQGPGWPGDYWPYTLYAGARASSSSSDLALMRRTGSGTTFLMYLSTENVPIYRGFDNRYNLALTDLWDSTRFCIMDLSLPHRVYRESTFMQWCPQKASADSLVRLVADSAYAFASWDGLYLDECTLDYPTWKEGHLPASFDCDGDGLPDNVAKLRAQWHTWRPYLTQRLRAVSGSKIIIANAGGFLTDSSLNGICIESVGGSGKPDSTTAVAAMLAQQSVGASPFLGVVWSQASAERIPCLSVVRQVPGVYYGITSGDPHSLP